jgi:hypothetical protein
MQAYNRPTNTSCGGICRHMIALLIPLAGICRHIIGLLTPPLAKLCGHIIALLAYNSSKNTSSSWHTWPDKTRGHTRPDKKHTQPDNNPAAGTRSHSDPRASFSSGNVRPDKNPIDDCCSGHIRPHKNPIDATLLFEFFLQREHPV